MTNEGRKAGRTLEFKDNHLRVLLLQLHLVQKSSWQFLTVLEYFQWLRTHCLRRGPAYFWTAKLIRNVRVIVFLLFKKNFFFCIIRLFSFEIRIHTGYHKNFMSELKVIFYDIYQFILGCFFSRITQPHKPF